MPFFSSYPLFQSSSSAAVGGCDCQASGYFLWELRGRRASWRKGGCGGWGGQEKASSWRNSEGHTSPLSTQGRKDSVCVLAGSSGAGSAGKHEAMGSVGSHPQLSSISCIIPLSPSLMSSLLFSWIFLFRGCFFNLIKAAILFPKLYLGGPVRTSAHDCFEPFSLCTTAQLPTFSRLSEAK